MKTRVATANSLLLFLLLVSLAGCGAEGQSPQGGAININPAGKAWDVAAGACTFSSPAAITDFEVVSISVIGSNGLPQNDVDITVSLDLSSGESPTPVLELYDDENGNNNNFPDAGELVLSPYNTKTKLFGTKRMIVTMDLGGCEYRGQLSVTTGTVFASADFEVTNP